MIAVELSKLQNSSRNSRQMRVSTSRILRNSAVAGLLALLGGCSTVPAALDGEALQAGVSTETSMGAPAREFATPQAADPLLVAKARTLAQADAGGAPHAGGTAETQALVAKAKAMAQSSAIPDSGSGGDATDQMMLAQIQALTFGNSARGGVAQPQGLIAPAAPLPQATYRQEIIARSEALGGRMPPEEIMSRLKALSSASASREAAQADNIALRSDRSAPQGNDPQTARLVSDQTLQRLRELAAQAKSQSNASPAEAAEPRQRSPTMIASAADKPTGAVAAKQVTASGVLSQAPAAKEQSTQVSAAQKPFSALGGGVRAAALAPDSQSPNTFTR